MRIVLPWIAVSLLLASCKVADPPPRQDLPDVEASAPVSLTEASATPPLTADGWGPLRIGMSREEVVSSSGEDADPEAVGGPDPEQCDEFHPSRAPGGMLVMIERGSLTRISLINDAVVKTDEGFGVGALATSVKAAYGPAAVSTPHRYLPAPGEYVTVWKPHTPLVDARGIVYEIGLDGRASHVRAGGPSIEYVEGCL